MVHKSFFSFLEKNLDPSRPVLLALSGGPDSLALFYLLLEYSVSAHKFDEKRVTRPSRPGPGRDALVTLRSKIQIGVAHVDHRWREESTEEAALLQERVTHFQIPFHLKTLDPNAIQGNAEEFCRLERLQFFSDLCDSHNYQAVLLGHHADDQAETVLKKVFEGGQLSHLGGMSPVSTFKGLKIWRPLLQCTKLEILDWLRARDIQAFEDRTNLDPRYLRGRFRTNLMPALSKEFGKEIRPTLCRIGQEALELKNYLEDQLKNFIDQIQKGPFGSLLDLSSSCPRSDFELKYLIKKMAELENVRIPHSILKETCQKIRSKVANCQLLAKNLVIQLDRGRLFILSKPHFQWESEPIILTVGKQTIGQWEIEVERFDKISVPMITGWKAVWGGQMRLYLPDGHYRLEKADRRLDKAWTNEKVPAFLRWFAPVISSNNHIIHEFLTSKVRLKNDSKGILIIMRYG